jgi:hypothetical protein
MTKGFGASDGGKSIGPREGGSQGGWAGRLRCANPRPTVPVWLTRVVLRRAEGWEG